MASKDSSTSPDLSISTTETSPPNSPGMDSDIWASDHENDVSEPNVSPSHHPREELLSDLPTIKRQHMTSGYREGLSVGKAKVMQWGFDTGYPLGAAIAMRIGTIYGVFEGYLHCVSIGEIPGMRNLVQTTYDRARSELAVDALLGMVGEEAMKEWGESGVPPEKIEKKLSGWEGTVVGVWESRVETKRLYHVENHGLKDLIDEQKVSEIRFFQAESSCDGDSDRSGEAGGRGEVLAGCRAGMKML